MSSEVVVTIGKDKRKYFFKNGKRIADPEGGGNSPRASPTKKSPQKSGKEPNVKVKVKCNCECPPMPSYFPYPYPYGSPGRRSPGRYSPKRSPSKRSPRRSPSKRSPKRSPSKRSPSKTPKPYRRSPPTLPSQPPPQPINILRTLPESVPIKGRLRETKSGVYRYSPPKKNPKTSTPQATKSENVRWYSSYVPWRTQS